MIRGLCIRVMLDVFPYLQCQVEFSPRGEVAIVAVGQHPVAER
jgi:hypothetical protein